jgi:hypothetical protein
MDVPLLQTCHMLLHVHFVKQFNLYTHNIFEDLAFCTMGQCKWSNIHVVFSYTKLSLSSINPFSINWWLKILKLVLLILEFKLNVVYEEVIFHFQIFLLTIFITTILLLESIF